jgi:hypothetical protein
VPKNCAEVLKCGGKNNGIYSIDPDGKGAFKVNIFRPKLNTYFG